MLHFIDFEVFKYDWLCVIVEPFSQKETVIVNDKDKLQKYYDEFKDQIFVGYNIRNYDQFIFKSILMGIDPKIVNDKIIVENRKGFEISDLFNQIPLLCFDIMTTTNSLKKLEGFMGHNIHETAIDFDLDRKLTDEEIEETIKYCRNDVYETITVFTKKYEEFETMISLISAFDLPLKYINKTKAQLSAIILDCHRIDRNDEWDISLVDTLKLNKYKYISEWFLKDENHNYDAELTTNVAGVEHKFAWGGIHGARERYHGKGGIWHVDVEGYYPALMIEYNLLSRNVTNPSLFKDIRDKRIEYKKQKNPLQKPFKIVVNATYGICKDKYSAAYDPRNANLVCVNGQLLLLDLIEKLERIKSFELIQSNTDGLILKISQDKETETEFMNICKEWENRTRMGLAYDKIDEIWQKDVNNYVFRFENGKYERKGSYIKENNALDNDMPILNIALLKAITENIQIEKTINECNDLVMFQKILKISNKYKYGWHNNEKLNDKTYRVFASTDKNDTYIGKQKSDGATIEKFANTAENVFIDNGDIIGKEIPDKLDKSWYINEAKKRYESYVC